MEEVQNVLVVLQKYSLLDVDINNEKGTVHYKLDMAECILRLSVPRFLE